MLNSNLRRALEIQQAAIYRDPDVERLLTDAITVHERHPELCPTGCCRAGAEAARILATAGMPS